MAEMSSDPVSVFIPTFTEGNPYSTLLTKALEKKNVESVKSEHPPIFPLTLGGVLSDEIDVIHLDWIYQFYMTTPTSSDLFNALTSIIRGALFIIDLFVVSVSKTGLVWTVHNKYHHENEFRRTERVVNEAAFLFANEVTVKCESAARILDDEYILAHWSEFHIVRDGSYHRVYPDNISRETARQKHLIKQDDFVYLYFGSIREYKGVDTLIKASKKIDADNIQIWIVGNPANTEIKENIKQMASQIPYIKIEFDYIPADSVQEYFNMADVLVLPYKDILNSGGVYLGLTFGMPIISPSKGCIPATLPAENSGLLYDGSCGELVNSMQKARDNSDLERISAANYRQGREYDWETPAKQLSQLYRTV